MAPRKPTSLSITGLVLSLLLITSAASRHKHFEDFDVSASLRQALQALSPIQQQQQRQQKPLPVSLTLHSRFSLLDHNNNNYTCLTLSRLARDEARVNSLHSRRARAISTRPGCNCKSVRSPQRLESPVTSGLDEGSGEYFVQIGVGRPAKEYHMILDTGSDVSWLQCRPCSDCYLQAQPIFNPAASATYTPLSCKSRQCAALQESACLLGSCTYEVSYGDGSYTIGNLATETISFGSSGSVPDVAIGCGHDNDGLYSGAAGLLSFGGGELSLPSQVRATSFSYCLVNRDSSSSSTLEINSPRPADSVTAPLLTNPRFSTYRYVGLTGISVGGRPVQFPSSLLEIGADGEGGVIVDSGTTVTRLPEEVYDSVRDAFKRMSRNLPSAGRFSLLDTCYDLSSLSTVRVPTLSFQFSGGETLALPPSNYLIPVDGHGKFCFAFAATSVSPSIIGNIQQQGMRVSYDLVKKSIGFSANKC